MRRISCREYSVAPRCSVDLGLCDSLSACWRPCFPCPLPRLVPVCAWALAVSTTSASVAISNLTACVQVGIRLWTLAVDGICSGTGPCAEELFPHGNRSRLPKACGGVPPPCEKGLRTNSTRRSWSRWPKSGYGWRLKPSKSVRENLRSTSCTRRRFMAERLGLVGKARPHLCHLQHRGFGLSVGGVAGDFQAPRRKPAILLGAPHLPTSNSLTRVQRSRMPERSGLPPGEAAYTSE